MAAHGRGLPARVEAMLAPGGAIARGWPGFEERPGQRSLAIEIAETIADGGVRLAEAPTGIGKSLAYLLPGVLHAAESGQRVVIATCTRSLQDQLFERDLPALLAALDLDIGRVRLKGKQNYVCTRALDLVTGAGAEEEETLGDLRAWAETEAEGDLDRFPARDPESFLRLRGRVGADPDACTLLTCRRGRECFWVRARRQAAEAKILVVNHALLALSAEVEGLLPDFDTLIVDEAHRLEGVLLSQLERTVSRNRFEELLRVLGTARGGRRAAGLLARVRTFVLPLLAGGTAAYDMVGELDRLVQRAQACRDDVEALFARFDPPGPRHELYGARARYRSATELVGRDLAPLETVLAHCTHYARTLGRFAAQLDQAEASAAALELSAELGQVAGRWTALGSDLLELCEAARGGWVYWRTAGGRGLELHGSPVTAGEHARRLVIGRARAAILTSATLSAGGDFAFTADRLGLGESFGMPYIATSHPSPFDLVRQMRGFVLEDPARDEADAVAELVAALAAATRRNQLVLFTAHERLRRARERLLARLPEGTTLLAQDWDGAVSLVTERFRESRGAVLLGVQSLWEGVDFPGEELEIVVVARLPFSVPDDPRVEARAERLREQGLDPFRADAVPEAVLRFRQGLGRLIRRADDRGVLVVSDPRLLTASYRRPFLNALPVMPRRCADPRSLAQAAARFLDGGDGWVTAGEAEGVMEGPA